MSLVSQRAGPEGRTAPPPTPAAVPTLLGALLPNCASAPCPPPRLSLPWAPWIPHAAGKASGLATAQGGGSSAAFHFPGPHPMSLPGSPGASPATQRFLHQRARTPTTGRSSCLTLEHLSTPRLLLCEKAERKAEGELSGWVPHPLAVVL